VTDVGYARNRHAGSERRQAAVDEREVESAPVVEQPRQHDLRFLGVELDEIAVRVQTG